MKQKAEDLSLDTSLLMNGRTTEYLAESFFKKRKDLNNRMPT